MKYFGYVFRNIRRNPIRTTLTICSIAMCLFLVMTLGSYVMMGDEAAGSANQYNRLLTMSSQGFTQPVPFADVAEVSRMEGVATVGDSLPADIEFKDRPAVSPFSWYGGKYQDESMPGAQFGIDGDTVFSIMTEMKLPLDQLKAFRADPSGCVVGKKLAADKKLKIGSSYNLKSTIYEYDLKLTIRGIYDAPENRDNRMCFFHWKTLDEGLRKNHGGRGSGNAGSIYFKCKDASAMPVLIKKVDDAFRNSATPTKTQTEEQFAKMFSEMLGDLQKYILFVGIAVGMSLICVCAVAIAMSMRERTTEVAVLKAIGFGQNLVLFLVLLESFIVAFIGGFIGTFGTKLLFTFFDPGKFIPQFLPLFYVPWTLAIGGLIGGGVVGIVSGAIPAFQASRLSVIQGLRKVV